MANMTFKENFNFALVGLKLTIWTSSKSKIIWVSIDSFTYIGYVFDQIALVQRL